MLYTDYIVTLNYGSHGTGTETKIDAINSTNSEADMGKEVGDGECWDGYVTLPTPVPNKGYEFWGWKLPDGTTTHTEFDVDKFSSNITVVAQYHPLLFDVEYSARFEGDEGERWLTYLETYTYDSRHELLTPAEFLNDFEEEGYTLLTEYGYTHPDGWILDGSDDSIVTYSTDLQDYWDGSDDHVVSLCLHFRENFLQITYDLNEASYDTTKTNVTSCNYTQNYNLNAGLYDYNYPTHFNASRQGYHMIPGQEWYVEGNPSIVLNQADNYMDEFPNHVSSSGSLAEALTGDSDALGYDDVIVTVVANWKPNKYKVQLDKQGGTGGTNAYWYLFETVKKFNGKNVYYYKDADCTLSADTVWYDGVAIICPTRPYATFKGYWSEPGGKGTQFVYGYEEGKTPGSRTGNIYKEKSEDVTLYAHWEEWSGNEYTFWLLGWQESSDNINNTMISHKIKFSATYKLRGRETFYDDETKVQDSTRCPAGKIVKSWRVRELESRTDGGSDYLWYAYDSEDGSYVWKTAADIDNSEIYQYAELSPGSEVTLHKERNCDLVFISQWTDAKCVAVEYQRSGATSAVVRQTSTDAEGTLYTWNIYEYLNFNSSWYNNLNDYRVSSGSLYLVKENYNGTGYWTCTCSGYTRLLADGEEEQVQLDNPIVKNIHEERDVFLKWEDVLELFTLPQDTYKATVTAVANWRPNTITVNYMYTDDTEVSGDTEEVISYNNETDKIYFKEFHQPGDSLFMTRAGYLPSHDVDGTKWELASNSEIIFEQDGYTYDELLQYTTNNGDNYTLDLYPVWYPIIIEVGLKHYSGMTFVGKIAYHLHNSGGVECGKYFTDDTLTNELFRTPIPVRGGYNFLGYATSSGVMYINQHGVFVSDSDNEYLYQKDDIEELMPVWEYDSGTRVKILNEAHRFVNGVPYIKLDADSHNWQKVYRIFVKTNNGWVRSKLTSAE